MRQLVAVPAMPSPRVEGLRYGGYAVAARIAESIFQAGGDPVLLPPIRAGQTPQLARFDALVIPGGADLAPSEYGQIPADPDATYNLEHDRADIWLAREAVALNLPTLAICRGLQVLNVALGGTLHQDLPPTNVPHRSGSHKVFLRQGTAIREALGAAVVEVSTYHHQAVDELGTGLSASAVAADGCIEALEHRYAPVLAVQWHPEDEGPCEAAGQQLFGAFLNTNPWKATKAVMT